MALYPWVPDAASLVEWIEADFESKNPDIDLVVRSPEQSNVVDLAYDYDETAAALIGNGPDSQHLVEVDTVILDRLIAAGAVQPFQVGGSVSFLPAALEAVTWEGTVYGVPHWTCGYFVISRMQGVRQAGTVAELLSALEAAGTNAVDLVGDLDGSWNSIVVYLDAFRDTYPGESMLDALAADELESTVRDGLARVGHACTVAGRNYCGGEGDDDEYVEMFAQGDADALIGYSERLHPILDEGGGAQGNLYVASATLGQGDQPMLFTDALVLSQNCSTDRCRDAASEFAAYYVSDEVFEVVLMSLDVGESAVPRYLLPSTTSAFGFGKVGSDPLYRQLWQEVDGAVSTPNRGIPEARDAGVIRADLKQALGLE
ncbi:MAG: extracellular solute-binding protein [Acidobacteria bacterium]|nr:extracellular solute-binding protein [Acidobacteriota bacterium]